ncbi:MAG: hypothetical protein F6K50_05690 [Moorea sp. SIO3I7]|nr:hypothetical protein [Moorena sp. SIO3I7]
MIELKDLEVQASLDDNDNVVGGKKSSPFPPHPPGDSPIPMNCYIDLGGKKESPPPPRNLGWIYRMLVENRNRSIGINTRVIDLGCFINKKNPH